MKVFIYVRVSTQEQAKEGYSIGEQTERLTKYCEVMGWTVLQVFTDAGFSGASMDRPALQSMINNIAKADKVLVYKLDRLSRSQLDTLYLIEKVFLANNTYFVSLCENFDTSTPFGRAMIGILAVFAQLEREQIKERMQMGKEARAKEGKYRGSWNVPIGYDYKDGELVVNEYEKAQILELFDLFFAGVPIKRIIKDFEAKGYKHKYGLWNDRTIRNVLGTKTNIGYICYRGEWYKGLHEPIITAEMYEKARFMLDERKRIYEQNKRPGKAQSYLAGLIYCKRCGARYHKISKGYYVCASKSKHNKGMVKNPNCKNQNWKMETLDKLIFDEVRKLAIDKSYFENPIDKPDKRASLLSALSDISKKQEKLLNLYLDEDLPSETLSKKSKLFNREKDRILQALAELDEKEKQAISKRETLALVDGFGAVLDSGDFLKIRGVLLSLIDRIEIDGEEIEIHWNFT